MNASEARKILVDNFKTVFAGDIIEVLDIYTASLISSNSLKETPIVLTDAATISWDVLLGYNASVTLGGNRTLSMTNLVAGRYYTLKVTQGSGGQTLTLPAEIIVFPNGAGIVPLSPGAGDVDLLTFYYDGIKLNCTYTQKGT